MSHAPTIHTNRKNGMTPPQPRALLHHHSDANTVEKAQLRWPRHDISSQRFSREAKQTVSTNSTITADKLCTLFLKFQTLSCPSTKKLFHRGPNNIRLLRYKFPDAHLVQIVTMFLTVAVCAPSCQRRTRDMWVLTSHQLALFKRTFIFWM